MAKKEFSKGNIENSIELYAEILKNENNEGFFPVAYSGFYFNLKIRTCILLFGRR
jgi:hypothetical protein